MRRAHLLLLLPFSGCMEARLHPIGDPAPAPDGGTETAPTVGTAIGPRIDTGPTPTERGPSALPGRYELPLPEPMDACADTETSWDLELAWEWTGWSDDPRVRHVRTTPQLGDVDGDGHLDVVFIAIPDDDAPVGDVLFALDGRTGDQILAVPDVFGFATRFALADLDGDDDDEVVVMSGGDVVALDLLGTLWVHTPARDCDAHLLPGDFDDDGQLELITGCGSLNPATGALVSDEPRCVRTAFDADGDGALELFCDDRLVDSQGNTLATLAAPSLGVAPHPGGGFVAKTADGFDTYDASWTRVGSEPTLSEPAWADACMADADTDGRTELFLPFEGALAAFTLDGPHRWSVAREAVPGSTGSRTCTTVDLDADGCAEVVWPQNGSPHVHDAATGVQRGHLLLGEADSTRLQPLPIDDLDGDGSLDIVVNGSALGDPDAHWAGVRVVREAHGAWIGDAPVTRLTGPRSRLD